MNDVVVLVLAAIAFVSLTGLWLWLSPRDGLMADVDRLASNVGGVIDGLRGFHDACEGRPEVDSVYTELAGIVTEHQKVLDDSRTLIGEVSEIIKRAKLTSTSPGILTGGQPVDIDALKLLHAELLDARTNSLTHVHHALTEILPDMREKLSQLPIQGGSIAVGLLSLIGVVWMSGYYGILGVPFIPLLRDLKDIALVGFGAGLLPLMAFAGMVSLTLRSIYRTRAIARQPMASAAEISDALLAARKLRQPGFWTMRAALCMVTVFFVSMAAAAVNQERSSFDVVLTGKPGSSQMRILGGIGDYIVFSSRDDNRVITLPKDRLECFETGMARAETRDSRAASCARAAPPADKSANIVVSLEQPGDWRSYVQREAQCWVVAPATPRPLLTPAFIANSSDAIDFSYYEQRPHHWPYPEFCAADSPQSCPYNGIQKELKDWLDEIDSHDRATLHLFGFASGTAGPVKNKTLSLQRADFIARQLIEYLPELNSCTLPSEKSSASCPIQFQLHGKGEMPKFIWAGTQGDPTEQVVLIAACNHDTL